MPATRTVHTAATMIALLSSIGLSAMAQTTTGQIITQSTLTPRQACAACAQPPNVALSRIEVPAGTWITARTDSALSTRYAREGSPFFATVATPIHDANGNVLIPQNTQLLGRVVSSVPGHRFLRHGAQLAIGIDAVKLNGAFVPVTARVADVPRDGTMGLLRRQQASLPPGSSFQFQLQQPVTVGMIRTVKTAVVPTALGGGPRPAHHHAQSAPRPAQQQPCVRAPGGT